MAGSFIPRAVFPTLDSLPRSYYLGHHRAGLNKMKTMLSQIDLIFECRDYRVPLTSRNPMFEESLGGRERVIVYTKRDLGSMGTSTDLARERIIRQWHAPSPVLFTSYKSSDSVNAVLKVAKEHAASSRSLTGSRMMVVGMPNVGKSTLLNSLRNVGTGRRKAVATGAQPGITRAVHTGVKIVEGNEDGGSVYLIDTPGVFMPYLPDPDAMLKLSLCGSVKDTIIAPTALADYLLFHINLVDPKLYAQYDEPTNDVMQLLEAIARKTGRLQKGGIPDTEASALWMIQRWRGGHLGCFILDEVTEDALERRIAEEKNVGVSVAQARRKMKDTRRMEQAAKRQPAVE
ncbi:MAG: Mitochondrial GTPase [Bogoriella megaspora]|nr:MAG: Mitochondrial GTPase [Bogoriella megaspora]